MEGGKRKERESRGDSSKIGEYFVLTGGGGGKISLPYDDNLHICVKIILYCADRSSPNHMHEATT